MVLDHVPQGTGVVIVAAPGFNAQPFSQGNLDIFNRVGVPNPLKQGVAKTQGQDILHHFLTQVVVDPEDLVFSKRIADLLVQDFRAGQVSPEWLFNHQAVKAGPGQMLVGNVFGDRPKEAWGHGHVEDAVAAAFIALVQFLGQLLQSHIVFNVGYVVGLVVKMAGKFRQLCFVDLFPAFMDSLGHLLAQVFMRPWPPGCADNGKIVMNDIPAVEIEEGRIDLAVGQVAAAAEKDHYCWNIVHYSTSKKSTTNYFSNLSAQAKQKRPRRNVLFVYS